MMSEALETGCVLSGRYAIERQIGQGGMATVYRAADLRQDRHVAVKVLNPELAAVMGVQRFIAEIRITGHLVHPNIISVHDSGEWSGLPYFVMPYVDGESLEHRIARERRLTVADALRIARQVADALAYAHDKGVIHRDIKPGNILLHAGHAVVADFGIARAIERATDEQRTASGVAIGTRDYMPPEQEANDPDLDARADIYSLGCVLFEMLTGLTPNAARRWHQLPPDKALRRLRRDVRPDAAAVILRAIELEPDDRFASAHDFAGAIETARPRPGSRRKLPVVLAALAVVCATVGWAIWKYRGSQQPERGVDANLVAVAPFYVASSDPEVRAWKDHLALIVQQRLDGAGTLRALSPSVATHAWPAVSDRASALMLGRRTGAGLVTFGTLLETGSHAFRTNVEIFDVAQNTMVDEIQAAVADPELDVDQLLAQLSDSLSHHLLERLGLHRRVGAVARGAFGCSSSSWPAVRAYLRGEQFYRRTMWDSATAAYRDAIAIDSTCALAYRRVAIALAWESSDDDSLVLAYKLRAGANKRGLAPRDSLLVTADSITAVVHTLFNDSASAPLYWKHAHRLFATLEEAARRYPGDPEIWYALGDARYHFGWGPASTTPSAILAAFDSAIALDPGFGPSYIHPIEMGFALSGDTLAMRYAHAYLATKPTGVNAEGATLVTRLVEDTGLSQAKVQRVLDSASTDAILAARLLLDLRRDSLQSAVILSQVVAQREGLDSSAAPGHCGDVRYNLARRLARRGRLGEARCAMAGRTVSRLFAELALAGGVRSDSAARQFEHWLSTDRSYLAFALPWWSERRDTLSIARSLRDARALLRGPRATSTWHRAAYDSNAALAYLALERHEDSALERFLRLPDTLCLGCFDLDRLKTAQLLASTGRLREARDIAEEWRGPWVMPSDVLFALELGRVTEQLGDREASIAAYRVVIESWAGADDVLQPVVSEARDAIRRLTGDVARGKPLAAGNISSSHPR